LDGCNRSTQTILVSTAPDLAYSPQYEPPHM
jgi:hypothetical protein